MKNTFLLVLCGLIVFVAIYTFVIPESNMPVRIKTETIWETDDAVSELLFESENFKISQYSIFAKNEGKWKNIGYPTSIFSDKLPSGISWPAPEIRSAAEIDSTLFIKISGDKIAKYDGRWGESVSTPDNNFTQLKPAGKGFSGEIILINGNICFKFGDLKKQIEIPGISDNPKPKKSEKFIITTDGKIKNTETGVTSTREDFDPFLIPKKILEIDDSIYVLMESTSNHTPESWVYKFSNELKLEEQMVYSSLVPVDINLWNGDTLLILWQNGIISSHTLWGQEKYQFEVTKEIPLDMHVYEDMVFVLTNKECLTLTLTSKTSELTVWPRILNLGNISKQSTLTLFIESTEFPQVGIKGDGVKIKSIIEENNGYKIEASINPDEQTKYHKVTGELLIEVDGNHEVIPYIFTPIGEIKKFKIFTDKLLDLETGEFIPYTKENDKITFNKESDESLIYADFLSGYVFLLNP